MQPPQHSSSRSVVEFNELALVEALGVALEVELKLGEALSVALGAEITLSYNNSFF